MKIIDNVQGITGSEQRVRVFNITWDVEMDTDIEAPSADVIDQRLKENDLFDEVIIVLDGEDDIKNLDIIQDILSRETGFCVTGLDIEEAAEDADIDWEAVGELMKDSGLVQDEESGMWQFEEEDEDEEDGIAIYGDYLSPGAAAMDLWSKLWNDLDDVRADLKNAADNG